MAKETFFCKTCMKNIETGTLDRLYYCNDPLCNNNDNLGEMNFERVCKTLQQEQVVTHTSNFDLSKLSHRETEEE